jgi:hypothetical protein
MAGMLWDKLRGTIRAVSGVVFSAVNRGISPRRALMS